MIRRILMLGISTSYGGTESVIFSMLPYWRDHGYFFDFINTYEKPLCREDELKRLGARIWPLNLRRRGRLFAYRKSIRTFFAEHKGEYYGIWLNMQEPEHAAVLAEAKKNGVSQRIVLAHYAGFGAESSRLRAILLWLNRRRINKAASIRIAVSSLAGQYAFPGQAYSVINSGVDASRFAFSKQRRDATRRDLMIPADSPLYACAGRLTKSKNHRFLLEVFHEIVKRKPNARFILIGGGELELELRSYAARLGLTGLRFVTDCNDISKYLDAADAFVFPSLHEGMGMVLIEAQCSGLPCFASSNVIPQEARILENFTWVGLERGAREWADLVLRCDKKGLEARKEAAQIVVAAGLSKEKVAQKYLDVLFPEEE